MVYDCKLVFDLQILLYVSIYFHDDGVFPDHVNDAFKFLVFSMKRNKSTYLDALGLSSGAFALLFFQDTLIPPLHKKTP